jgi:hypothetical protein
MSHGSRARVMLLREVEKSGSATLGLRPSPAETTGRALADGYTRSPAVNQGSWKTGHDLAVRRRNRGRPAPERAFQAREPIKLR